MPRMLKLALPVVVVSLLAAVWFWLEGASPADSDRGTTGLARSDAVVARPTDSPASVAEGSSVALPLRAEPASLLPAPSAGAAAIESAAAPVPQLVLIGRVLDDAGRPVPDALVTLVTGVVPQMQALAARGAMSDMSDLPDSAATLGTGHTRCDEAGHFRLQAPVPKRKDREQQVPAMLDTFLASGDRLLLEHPAFVPGNHTLPILGEGEHDVGDFVLSLAGSVRGRVLGSDRRPLTGARVGARRIEAAPGDLSQMLGRMFGSLEDALATTTSDASGRFLLGGVSPGQVLISVGADEHVIAQREGVWVQAGLTHDLGDVQLEAGQSIIGLVRDGDGAPAAGVQVRALRESHGNHASLDTLGAQLQVGGLGRTTHSDSDGLFVLSGLSEGTYSVRAGSDGWSHAQRDTVRAGRDDLLLTCHRLGELLVRVSDAEGVPVSSGASLQAWALPRDESADVIAGEALAALAADEIASGSAPKDAALPDDLSGLFLVTGAGREGTRLRIVAPGLASVELTAPAVLGAQRVSFPVSLLPEARIEGRVVDIEGQPLVGASVRASSGRKLDRPENDVVVMTKYSLGEEVVDESASKQKTRTDEQGAFVLAGLAEGAWSLVADAVGMLPAEAITVELRPGLVRDDLLFLLLPGGSLTCTVFESDGAPVVGAQLVVELEPGSASMPTTPEGFTDRLGRNLALSFGAAQGKARSVRTGADGSVLLQGLVPGSYTVTLKKDSTSSLGINLGSALGMDGPDPQHERVLAVTAGEHSRAEFVRPARAQLSVDVYADGRPVPGAQVSLADSGSSLFGVEIPLGSRIVLADAQGSARFESLEPGAYRVSASAPGASQLERTEVELGPGERARVELRFGNGVIAGRVVDGDSGAGVAGVTVNAHEVSPPQSGEGGGLLAALFGGGGGGSGSLKGKSTTSFGISINGKSSSGSSSSGDGGAGLGLGLSPDRVSTGADGRFELRLLRPGRYTVSAGDGQWLPTISEELDVSADGRPANVQLSLQRGATLSGLLVEGSSEDPLHGVKIELRPADGGETRETYSQFGRYRLQGVLPGEYLLVVPGKDDIERASRPVSVPAGAPSIKLDLVTLN